VQVAPDTGFRSDGQEFDPTLFDLARRRNICLLPDGDFTYRVSASWSGALLKDLGVKTGIIVPLTGATGRGELVLAGIPLLSWDHLRLAVAIAQKVANAIDRREFELAAQEAALSRLRHSVARNLHDSVAQSLAGARFWLQALKMKAGTATGLISEIDTIQAALESENLHIRNLIGQLRNEGVESIERNLSNDIEVLLVSLSQQWRIDARLKEASNALFVPYLLSFEVQQIIREALANAVRHGQADAVEIGLWRTDSGIRLVIGDNGQGFPDPAKITAPHSISERVAELGGSLDISSMPGNSRLDITLPEVPFP
jgi:signal transduction histidine kinase